MDKVIKNESKFNKKTYNKFQKNPKYEPFKRKTPLWKTINSEVEELTAKYEQVIKIHPSSSNHKKSIIL